MLTTVLLSKVYEVASSIFQFKLFTINIQYKLSNTKTMLFLLFQKIKTLEVDGKLIKLQLVSKNTSNTVVLLGGLHVISLPIRLMHLMSIRLSVSILVSRL